MADVIEIEVEGMDKLLTGMDRFSKEIATNISAAGAEAAREILDTEGLRRYPPETEANQPGRYSLSTHREMGYYVRGRGAVSPSGLQYTTSERLGTQFYVKRGRLDTTIGNRASYAPFVVGDKQARFHKARGWRTLWDVANEKIPEITRIFQQWINQTIKDCKL